MLVSGCSEAAPSSLLWLWLPTRTEQGRHPAGLAAVPLLCYVGFKRHLSAKPVLGRGCVMQEKKVCRNVSIPENISSLFKIGGGFPTMGLP